MIVIFQLISFQKGVDNSMRQSTLRLNRNRLINAVIFFAANTRHCGKVKLFKLLYLLDFEHFRMTGRSVTGAEYSAWKMGPVPTVLYDQWDDPDPDFADAVRFETEQVFDFRQGVICPKRGFDKSDFTCRQLKLMDKLAKQYKDARSAVMIDVTHAENGAWQKVWNGGAGKSKPIPYTLAVADDDEHRDFVLETFRFDQMRERAIQSMGF